MKKTYITVILWVLLYLTTKALWYTFGILSHDDTSQSIATIEAKYNITFPMVSFIRDDYNSTAVQEVWTLASTLGTWRIYHITLSPREYTAEQVYQWYFDREYWLLFKHIKQNQLKVVFRTMHEMNGWRYPRSWDPEAFKKARIHIHKLSREAWLDQSQILFNFSTNGWDMPNPSWYAPSQQSPLIKCTSSIKQQQNCITREDYYPGDMYVDIIGVSFYNRWKATSDRQRLTPQQIMEEPEFRIRERLKKPQKPIIIDEVGTTSVRYTGSYQRQRSLDHYNQQQWKSLKNQRIKQLTQRALSKSELVGLSYFNVDRTIWLSRENPWEADWMAINLDTKRYYEGIMQLYQWWDNDLHQLFINPILHKKDKLGTWKHRTLARRNNTKQ